MIVKKCSIHESQTLIIRILIEVVEFVEILWMGAGSSQQDSSSPLPSRPG
jgi:hypothetical protein